MRAAMIGAIGVVGVAVVLYAVLCWLLYAQQDNFIFFRVANDPQLVARWQSRRVEIQGDVGIEGWWADGGRPSSPLTILYFGGNAEDVLYTAEAAPSFACARMLVANYRGYGNTAGEPSERALFQDALTIYDYAVKQSGVSAENIVVVGRSLGSGVATYLAAHRSVRGVVLITPYDSMVAVAQGHYPVFPVRWLLKHRFTSDERAKTVSVPVLMLAAELDNVVPVRHAQRLAKSWAGAVRLHVLSGVGHNDIETNASYFQEIDRFLIAAE